jgi:hypothetical protein
VISKKYSTGAARTAETMTVKLKARNFIFNKVKQK